MLNNPTFSIFTHEVYTKSSSNLRNVFFEEEFVVNKFVNDK